MKNGSESEAHDAFEVVDTSTDHSLLHNLHYLVKFSLAIEMCVFGISGV